MVAQQAKGDARVTWGARKASNAFLKWARLLDSRLAMVYAFLHQTQICVARRVHAAREKASAQCHPNARNFSPAGASGALPATSTALKCDVSRSGIHLSDSYSFPILSLS